MAIAYAPSSAWAQASTSDANIARNLLVRGYELGRDGRCSEAMPLLERSLELDPTAKAALNLARCEEESSKYGAALRHWSRARDLARDQGLKAVEREASGPLELLERRMPMIVVELDTDTPNETTVESDNIPVPREAMAEGMALDPGAHVITVRAPGREPHRVDIELSAGERRTLRLTPGPALAAVDPSADEHGEAGVKAPSAGAAASGTGTQGGSSARRSAGRATFWVGAGVAAAGLVTGAVTGIATLSQAGPARAHCTGSVCPPDAYADVEHARTMGTISTVSFGVAAAGAVAGAVGWWLWRSAPVQVAPTVGASGAMLGVGGRF
jgi:hypothetical protein